MIFTSTQRTMKDTEVDTIRYVEQKYLECKKTAMKILTDKDLLNNLGIDTPDFFSKIWASLGENPDKELLTVVQNGKSHERALK